MLFTGFCLHHLTLSHMQLCEAFKLKLTSAVTQIQLSVTEHTGEGSQVISKGNKALWGPNLMIDPSPLTYLFKSTLKH